MFNCWIWTGKRLLYSYWKDVFQDKIRYVMRYVVAFSMWTKFSVEGIFSKCDQIRRKLETADLVTFTEEILNEKVHFLCSERSLPQMLILTKTMWLTFKMTCCTFVFLQILLAGRLIRSYLTQTILSCYKFLLSF